MQTAARDALGRLARRRAVRLARKASAAAGTPFVVVGGAVRDALLGLPPGDLDVFVPRSAAAAFATALAACGGSRVVAVGREPRRILHVPLGTASVDVWAADEGLESELARRDFTVNALGLVLPGGRLVAPEGALEDLARRRLRLPRAGVLLEDPLRVVRAARFEVRLPGFRLDPAALPELRLAARRLTHVAPERRLAELDAILAAGPRPAARALARLDSWGALAELLPGVPAGLRSRGVARLRSASGGAPALLRAILLSPAGPAAADAALGALRASRRDRRLAATLLSLPPSPRAPSARDAVRLLRAAAPFSREAPAFVAAAHGTRGRQLALEAGRLLAARGALRRVLQPRRPLGPEEVARLLGVSGQALGAALAALDEALATGDVVGRRSARDLLRRASGAPFFACRTGPGTV
jgi:tRNA nucleotidyltransferase/poly(A) polymerase